MPNSRRFHKAIAVVAAVAVLAGVAILGASIAAGTPASAGADVTVYSTDVSYAPKGIERFGVTDIRVAPKYELQ